MSWTRWGFCRECRKLSDVDDAILTHAPDYYVNLIAPAEMSDMEIDKFYSNLREVMLYIKYSSDKEKLNKLIKEDSKFQNVGRQAVCFI